VTSARRCATAAAVVVAIAVASGLPASGAVVAPSVKVTGRSGYAQCHTASDAGDVVYTQAEVEPRVATSPADANDLVGVWQQDRWLSGGARGTTAAWSGDGGDTWHGSKQPFGVCGPGGSAAFHRVSDPWVSIGPDGTVYAVGLGVTDPPFGASGVLAAVSTDGGATWARERTIQFDGATSTGFNDKETITADPNTPGTAYVVWGRSVETARTFKVPAMFSKTTDGGNTWSTPKAIAANDNFQATVGNVIVVDPNTNALYNFFTYTDFFTGPQIRFVSSTNGGTSWSAPQFVNRLESVGTAHPVTNERVRTQDFMADVTIDPSNGTLYAVWQDARLNNGRRDEVVLSRSTNGGASWSRIVRVSSLVKRPAFTPTVAVNDAGTVGVTYYDFRFLRAGERQNLRTDFWLRTSTDGGRTFSGDKHVAGPFNMKAAPRSTSGYFIGDYMGLTTVVNDFVPFYVRTNCATGTCNANRTDVYAAVVTP
jgi:hypothetical protein